MCDSLLFGQTWIFAVFPKDEVYPRAGSITAYPNVPTNPNAPQFALIDHSPSQNVPSWPVKSPSQRVSVSLKIVASSTLGNQLPGRGRMRVLLALTVLLLGLSTAAAEPEYSSLAVGSSRHVEGTSPNSSVATEYTSNGDRLILSALSLPAHPDELWLRAVPRVSLEEVCNALLTSAQENNLPVPFFANLIWQESGLREDAVSAKGAMGIAQFMPRTAAKQGLDNPFDPLQAISASARLLHQLRVQLSNLGLAAAAYNAGIDRVSDWLEHRRTLPRETQNYVRSITGRSVDQWQRNPPDDAELHFVRRLPCRDMPVFAKLEAEQNQAERAREPQGQTQQAQANLDAAKGMDTPVRLQRVHFADRRHYRRNVFRRERIRFAGGGHPGDRHEVRERGHRFLRERHGRA
jgi:hypothetical protein